ncbi:MAG: hypothetical protein CMJ46_03165 [Planctomyces sp.]|nr:hypothetical protein [Planctomyces sp.]
MERDKALDKIKKLLARANDKAATAAEAESCLLKAQKLMREFNIDQAETWRSDESKYIQSEVVRAGRVPKEAQDVCSILTCHFFVKCVYVRHPDGTSAVELFGLPENVAVAEYVFHFLVLEFRRQFLVYRKTHPDAGQAGFYIGLSRGLHQKMRRATAASTSENSSQGNALIRLDNQLTVAFNRAKPDVRSSRVRSPIVTAEDLRNGYKAGQEINIRPGLRAEAASPTALPGS